MMDALSSKNFQPIQPDGYMLNSPPSEAPKIEITETDNLCQSPLSPSGCDVSLSEWDDFHHHGDGYLGEQSPRHQHHDPCDTRGSAFCRRSEGGPGKSPSPSRSSPRRHSPVPYSPKRQYRARNSASSVTSDDVPDVTLSPRCHSPVPFLPSAERPCSLPLNSAPPEEFICVTYTDPFSSPTITHTSEAILAISISCNHDTGSDQDVEMTSSDVNNEQLGSAGTSKCSSSEPTCSSAGEVSSADNDVLLEEDSSQCDCQEMKTICDRHTVTDNVKSPTGDNISASFVDNAKLAEGESKSWTSSEGQHPLLSSAGTAAEPSMRGPQSGILHGMTQSNEEGFHMDEVTSSDSSSDDDMDDMVPIPLDSGFGAFSASQPASAGVVSMSKSSGGSNTFPVRFGSENVCHGKCTQDGECEPQQMSCVSEYHHSEQLGQTAATSGDSDALKDRRSAEFAQHDNFSRGDALDANHGQGFSNEVGHSSNILPTGTTSRRESLPSQQPSLCSSPRSSCSSKEASPRRTLSQQLSKTPEDFALSQIVGSPPLHFPHCRDVMLVHCALPSPYDPDLPTPPIVLTPHTSYDDLNLDFYNDNARAVEDAPQTASKVTTYSPSGSVGDMNTSQDRPDISRSRSFPNLHQEGSDQFQEPHQCWPVLGGSTGHSNMNVAGLSEDSPGKITEFASDESCAMDDLSSAASSGSLPGSPSNSRAAVIGRLRRVVERRLSGTCDPSEAALQ